MILVIDASNVRKGGGVTYLREFLSALENIEFGFEKMVVWCRKEIEPTLPKIKKIEYRGHFLIDGNFIFREFWQRFCLARECYKDGCDLLFVPGGAYLGSFRPFVTMHRNSLPFDKKERERFGKSWTAFRYNLLLRKQSTTFGRSLSTIYLTENARALVSLTTDTERPFDIVIPHGVAKKFREPPRKQYPAEDYSDSRPFKFLYISIVNYYKHQWKVVEAIANLRNRGYPFSLKLIGSAHPRALALLENSLKRFDEHKAAIDYCGKVSYEKIEEAYRDCDAFIWASTCEAFGQILLEAMSSGLPIASSSKSCSPEILKDSGWYFDPEDTSSLERALVDLFSNKKTRAVRAKKASDLSLAYSWEKCATTTIHHLEKMAQLQKTNRKNLC